MERAGPRSEERLEIGLEHANNTYDPALAEKKVESERSVSHDSPPTEIENVDGRLWLTEDEALARARANPNDTRPIYVIFGPHDRDNPRDWAKAKKWYITCFASWLNVMTCLCAGGYSSGVGQLTSEFGVSDEVGTVGLSLYILVHSTKLLIHAPH